MGSSPVQLDQTRLNMPTYVDPTTAAAALSQTPLAQQPQANFDYKGGDLPVGVPHDQISNWLRGMNYSQGLDKLKRQMVPALLGHDYVPPDAQFNDTPTLQDSVRKEAEGQVTYPYLKMLELEFENNLRSPVSQGHVFPPGYNGNNRI